MDLPKPVLTKDELADKVRYRIMEQGGKAPICRENGGCVHRANLCANNNCEVFRLEILDEHMPQPPLKETAERTQESLNEIARELQGKKKHVRH